MANGFKTGGRAPGTANKATTQAREAIATFVDGNAHRLSEWLDRVAEENPAKAFELFQSVVEYHIPKLARTELDATVVGEIGIAGAVKAFHDRRGSDPSVR